MQAVFKESYSQIETVYTYSEWEKEHRKRNQQKRTLERYYLKQKLSGLLTVAVGIIAPFVDRDITFSIIIALPLGFYLLFTKHQAMTF